MIELLPGFRVAADHVRRNLNDGTNVVVVRGEASDIDIGRQLVCQAGLEERAVCLTGDLDTVDSVTGVLGLLWDRFAPGDFDPTCGIHGLIESGCLAYQICFVDLHSSVATGAWLEVIAAYAGIAAIHEAIERPVFLLSIPYATCLVDSFGYSSSVLRILDWPSIVSETDASVFSQHLVVDSSGGFINRSLKANVITTVAGTDFELAEFLGDYNLESFDDLARIIVNYRGDRLSSHSYLDGDEGKSLPFSGYRRADGGIGRHILRFAVGASLEAELDNRIWQGQVQVLFPFIEAKRRHAIETHVDLLTVPHTRPDGVSVSQVSDFEFGDLIFQLRSKLALRSIRESDRLHFLRQIRNSLAHFRPVSFRELTSNRQWLE